MTYDPTMSGTTHHPDQPVTLARLPRTGSIPVLLLVTMILGPGLLSPEFSASWLFRFSLVLLILMRVTMIRLVVTNQAVIVTNFFRTISVPLNDMFVDKEQPKIGYLELVTTGGETVHVGAAPSWGFELASLREQLLDEVGRRRGWR